MAARTPVQCACFKGFATGSLFLYINLSRATLAALNRASFPPAMPSTESAIQLLFSYGTLQLESVQRATFGRRLVGTTDGLPGFKESLIKIEDASVIATSGRTHHPIVRFTGRESDIVYGTALEVTTEELQNADNYEVSDYKRISVTLLSGARAWVYVDARQCGAISRRDGRKYAEEKPTNNKKPD
jgi:Gamma-glutamyl cyclotransferase, AIG2-like